MSVEAQAFKRACSSRHWSLPVSVHRRGPRYQAGQGQCFDDDARTCAGLRKWMNANGVNQPPTNGASNGRSNGAALTNGTTPRTNNAKPETMRNARHGNGRRQAKPLSRNRKGIRICPSWTAMPPSDNKEAEDGAIVGTWDSPQAQEVAVKREAVKDTAEAKKLWAEMVPAVLDKKTYRKSDLPTLCQGMVRGP